jgi:hypothetical protein
MNRGSQLHFKLHLPFQLSTNYLSKFQLSRTTNFRTFCSQHATRNTKHHPGFPAQFCLLSGFPPFCPRHLLGRVDTKKRQKECMGHRDLVFLPFSSRVVRARGLCFFFVFPRGKLVENSRKPDRRQNLK